MSGQISRNNNDIITTFVGQDPQGDIGDSSLVASLAENEQQIVDYTASRNKGNLVYGQEYLNPFHQKIANWTAPNAKLNVLFSGDSTTANFAGAAGGLDTFLMQFAKSDGMVMINASCNGHSGMDTEHWNSQYVTTDLAQNPDLYIVRWGINDPVYAHADNSSLQTVNVVTPSIDALRRTAQDYNTSLRAGLAKIRAQNDYTQLTIVLMSPSSTSDQPNGRYSSWYESIIPYIQQAARDYQCVFINTYQFLQDSVNASDTMDNLFGDGRHIHPYGMRNAWIVGLLYETILPKSIVNQYSTANLINDYSVSKTANASDLPNVYPNGISIYRATTNFPFNGHVITFKQPEGVLLQINNSYSTSVTGVAFRMGGSSAWGPWITIGSPSNIAGASYQNSWADYNTSLGSVGQFYIDGSSRCHLQGLIKPGTTTSGTVIFNLPAGYRPAADRYFQVDSDVGAIRMKVTTTGNVIILSGSPVSYVSLDQISFLATQ